MTRLAKCYLTAAVALATALVTTAPAVQAEPESAAATEHVSGLRVVRSGMQSAVPRLVMRYGGYLSRPHVDVREFLRANAKLLQLGREDIEALVPVQDYVTKHNGVRHVFLQQRDQGRVVYGSNLKLTIDRHGRVVTVGGAYFPGAAAGGSPSLAKGAAVLTAMEALHVRPERPFAPVSAQLVTFPLPSGGARLGWRTQLETKRGWVEAVVDAKTGRVLHRERYAHYAPEGNVFTVQHPDPGTHQQIVSFAGAAFDNAGWVTDRATAGNNANAYEDRDNDETSDYQPQTPPLGNPSYQHFDYTFTNALFTSGGSDIDTDRDAAITQAFYWVNFIHDYYYALGFDEPAGNFQEDNFGRGGAGGDGMLVEVHNDWNDTVDRENSNTQTPPGQRPRLELTVRGLFDGAMDEDLIIHEYTHGVSNRLVVGEATGGGLPEGIQTWALGEGWSDFFGTSITDDPIAGEYICGSPTGCPIYAYDSSPLVYSDLCTLALDKFNKPTCEPHRDGEIWTAALWDLRRELMVKYGAGPGKAQTEQLVLDGIKNTTPALASYLDARDAILAADLTNNSGGNQCLIWRVFAGREMGFSAATTADQATVTPAEDVPAGCMPTAAAGGPYVTPEGTDVQLSGSGSTGGGDPSAGAIVLYEWDLDNDGSYDASGASVPFTAVGQDGSFTVRLRVTNAAGLRSTDTATVTVTNAAPVVNLDTIASVLEGGAATLAGSGSDAGWRDVLSATVDWNDGASAQPLAGFLENVRPNATLTFSKGHTYGDNGTFAVKVCVSDDDVTTCSSVSAVVLNVNPTATIGLSGQTSYDGVSAYVTDAGGTVAVKGTAADPGSDDLTLTWNWSDGPNTVVTSLVNPPNPDPVKSPSVQPRNLTLTRSHTYAAACLHKITFGATDDDGGSGSDHAAVVVVGNADRMRGSGWWLAQYRPGPPDSFSPQRLQCYLDIAVFMSTVFDTPLTRAGAVDVLYPPQIQGNEDELFDEQLLAAWLDFANGAIGLADPVDTNGDGTMDSTFGAALLAAESVRTNPAATRAQLLAQKDILERIVVRDD